MFWLLVTLQIAQRLDNRPDSPYVARKTTVGVLRRTPGFIAIAFLAAGATFGTSDCGAEVAEDAFEGSGVRFCGGRCWGALMSLWLIGVQFRSWGCLGSVLGLVDAVVAVCYCVDEVVEDVPDQFLVKVGSCLLSTLDEFEEGAFGAVFHVDCSFGMMFLLFDECIVVFNDIGMAQVSKYAELHYEHHGCGLRRYG